MLFVVRHGERADYAGEEEKQKIQIEFDPHLTDLGKVQARRAGDQLIKLLDKYLEKSNKKSDEMKFLILSSPFQRCIQTAYHLSQALPKENIIGQKIYLNDFLAEHLDPLYYEKNILKDLQSRIDASVIRKHVDYDVQDGYPELGDYFSTPDFPEGNKIHKRVADGWDKLQPLYLEEINKEGNVVLILVTHGYVVECFLEMHKTFDYSKGVDYTCLSQYEVGTKGKSGKVVIAQVHDQLEIAEEEYKKTLAEKQDS